MIIFNQKMEERIVNENRIYFGGYFYYDNNLYRGNNAISFIGDNREKIYDIIGLFNGSFCFVIDNDTEMLLVCDRLRSKPLFYKMKESSILVSDCVETIRDKTETLNDDYVAEFTQNLLWMSKDKTLFNEIKQVSAGQIVCIDKKNNKQNNYDYFHFRFEGNYTVEQLKHDFWNTYDNVGKRLVEVLNGRTAIIPLSGGYDSRMVLNMLVRQHYKNIICYTYGNIKNQECVISREVAKKYNCKWLFVEYSKDYHRELWKKGIYQSYYKYAGNYSSLPHIQDFLAVYDLKKKKLVPEDGVFIPGHTGDMLTGGHITEEFLGKSLDKSKFIEIFNKKYYGDRPGYGFDYAREIFESVEDNDECFNVSLLLEKHEEINIKERQAKYIVNSCRVYEYFGFDWLIPLWDNELIEFWQKVPIYERYQRKFYIECVGEEIKTTHDESVWKNFVNFLRKYDSMFSILKTIGRIKDYWNNPFKIYAFFSFYEYIVCNFKNKGTDLVSVLFNKKYLDVVKKNSSV